MSDITRIARQLVMEARFKKQAEEVEPLDEVYLNPMDVYNVLNSLDHDTAHAVVSAALDAGVAGLGATVAHYAAKNRDRINRVQQIAANRSKGAKQAAQTRTARRASQTQSDAVGDAALDAYNASKKVGPPIKKD